MPEKVSRFERAAPFTHMLYATGDPALRDVADAIQQRATAESRGARGRKGPTVLGAEGLVYNEQTGDWEQPEAYKESRALEHQRMMERIAAQQARKGLPESTRRKVAEKTVEADIGEGILKDYGELVEAGEEILEPIAGAPAAAARAIGLPGAAAVYERATDTPAAINMRSRIADYVGPYRHARFGATLTGNEISEFEKVNPLAYGISHDESMKRLKRIQSWYRSHAEELAGGRAEVSEVPTVATQAPERPEGVTDEEWQSWLSEQGAR